MECVQWIRVARLMDGWPKPTWGEIRLMSVCLSLPRVACHCQDLRWARLHCRFHRSQAPAIFPCKCNGHVTGDKKQRRSAQLSFSFAVDCTDRMIWPSNKQKDGSIRQKFDSFWGAPVPTGWTDWWWFHSNSPLPLRCMVSGGTMHTHETTVDDCRPTFQFFIFPLFTSVLSLSLSLDELASLLFSPLISLLSPLVPYF